jgi:hypothetical protein
VALTTQLILALRLKKEYSLPLLPLWAFVACSRVNFTLYLYLYLPFVVLWPSTCFGHSYGHLQGDFFSNNTVIIKCLNHSKVLKKPRDFWLKFTVEW